MNTSLYTRRRGFLAALGLGSVALAPAQTSAGVADQTVAPSAAKDSTPASTLAAAPDIFQAAHQGDIPRATELAKLNPAIARLRSSDGRTPLHYAVAGGHTDMIFFLTTQGADLSAGPESPLLGAVNYPSHALSLEMTQSLLMNASDPNVKRADGRTALELASSRGYTDVVEALVHRGAIGAQGDAVKAERVYFAKRYSFDLEGRPYTAENIDGLPQEFINEFARLAHFDSQRVQHLLKLAPGLIGARSTWDESAIEAAAHMGLTPLARYLADHGAPVSTCTATLLGLRDRVESLIKSDAGCVRERGAHDIALLAYTAYGDQHAEIADMLLRAGASLQAKALGITTLHIAARKGYVELAEVLLGHGADVNTQAKSGGQEITPLGAAVKAKQGKMVEFLKSRGGRA
jgi:ankyrin repeat protein